MDYTIIDVEIKRQGLWVSLQSSTTFLNGPNMCRKKMLLIRKSLLKYMISTEIAVALKLT